MILLYMFNNRFNYIVPLILQDTFYIKSLSYSYFTTQRSLHCIVCLLYTKKEIPKENELFKNKRKFQILLKKVMEILFSLIKSILANI